MSASSRPKYPTRDDRQQFFRDLYARLNEERGVRSAAFTTNLPSSGAGRPNFAIEGESYETDADYPRTNVAQISTGYFETMGSPLLSGREFRYAETFWSSDTEGQIEPVAIVNKSFADKYLPDTDPLGKRFRLGVSDSENPWMRIVGVVPDQYVGGGTGGIGNDQVPPEQIYYPIGDTDVRFLSMVLRSEGAPDALAGPGPRGGRRPRSEPADLLGVPDEPGAVGQLLGHLPVRLAIHAVRRGGPVSRRRRPLRRDELRRRPAPTGDGRAHGGAEIPLEKQPLDAGFIELPERLLGDYRTNREHSELQHLLTAARRLRDEVDRVVVLGIGGSYMGTRALMQSCAHPYHNELSRGERGGAPRVYFSGNNVDNDAVAALLDLLGRGRATIGTEHAWGIVVISKSGGTLETAAAFRIFFRALLENSGGDLTIAARRVIPVTGDGSKLAKLTREIGVVDTFPVPDGVGGRFSIFSAVGLLPAAILGLDIVKLLEGAAAMNEHFRTAPPGDNRVLDYTGVCHLMELQRGATIRVLSVWSDALESAGLWYDQLLAESLGKAERGATPLTVVNTRDLHSRAQQHQKGARDKLFTNVIVESWRQDALTVERSQRDHDGLNRIADKSLPEIMSAAIDGTNAAYRDDARPTADIRMPHVNEFTMGQLFQMLMLATVVEGRLLGINPYGQPGVEAYKRHMQKNLELD